MAAVVARACSCRIDFQLCLRFAGTGFGFVPGEKEPRAQPTGDYSRLDLVSWVLVGLGGCRVLQESFGLLVQACIERLWCRVQ